jgi:hypothetical protein
VTADDVVRWKEGRLAQGRSTKTVANDVGEPRPIWTWGRANRKLRFSENPFVRLAPRTKKRAGQRVRGPYTEDEARHGVVVVHRGADVVFHPRSLAFYTGTPTVCCANRMNW